MFYLEKHSGGAGTYARELVRALLEEEPSLELTAFVGKEVPPSFVETFKDRVDFVHFPFTVTHGPPGNFVLTVGSQWGAIPLIAARRGIQVVHGLANITPLMAPRVATVVTLLDLIWMRHTTTLDRYATIGMRMTAVPSARFADRVIAISHAAADDLVATLKLPRSKIDVTHLGINLEKPRAEPAPADDVRGELGLGSDPIVLCVAQKREHKNVLGLVRAMAETRDQGARLVLPGAPTPHEAVLRAEAEALGIGDRVVFCDWLPDGLLEGLYAAASCFVLPSFEEGFGLPILEAMARDVPVATSNLSSMPEVAGDAALLFEPHSPTAIARAIDRLLEDGDLRADLVRRGGERCREFPWRATARATLDVYARALS